jgi:hypothetical protein
MSSQPAIVEVDAKDRAFRTFIQGLGIDEAIAVTLVLAVAFTTIEWTPTYWLTLAASLGRTILQSAVAYVMRVFVKPRLEKLGFYAK